MKYEKKIENNEQNQMGREDLSLKKTANMSTNGEEYLNNGKFLCAHCGREYSEELRGGSGTFCVYCEKKYDLD